MAVWVCSWIWAAAINWDSVNWTRAFVLWTGDSRWDKSSWIIIGVLCIPSRLNTWQLNARRAFRAFQPSLGKGPNLCFQLFLETAEQLLCLPAPGCFLLQGEFIKRAPVQSKYLPFVNGRFEWNCWCSAGIAELLLEVCRCDEKLNGGVVWEPGLSFGNEPDSNCVLLMAGMGILWQKGNKRHFTVSFFTLHLQ